MPRNSKKSWGIACCRNRKKGALEILLVRKRYTYYFAAFVFGQYNIQDDASLIFLFSGMTVQEKLEVLSLRFDILWYKIWLEFAGRISNTVSEAMSNWTKNMLNSNPIPAVITNPERMDFYNKKKAIYDELCQNPERIRDLMSDLPHGDLIWEIPKGRKNSGETSLDCAIREFREETALDTKDYMLLFDVPPVVSVHKSMSSTYTNTYHLAYTVHDFEAKVSLQNRQASEVGDIRWMGLEDVRATNNDRLYSSVKKIFNTFRSKYNFKDK